MSLRRVRAPSNLLYFTLRRARWHTPRAGCKRTCALHALPSAQRTGRDTSACAKPLKRVTG
eukprot:4811598-Pleurochrysis_carterae.AAC.1